MTQIEVTAAEEEYLETFFWFFEYGSKRVKTNQIAEMMNVDPGTVTSMLKKLSGKSLIDYKPYYGAELTSKGEEIARKVVRKHRISESFLEWLGVPWSKIHEEACKWEHVLTDEIAEMIEEKLNPKKTPYGAPIPQKDRSQAISEAIQPLALFNPGETIEITVSYEGKPRVAKRPPWDGGFTWAQTKDGSPWIATTCQGEGADLWWPNKDHVSDKPDRMGLHITVPEGLFVATNGKLMGTKSNSNATTTYDWLVSTPTAGCLYKSCK